MLLSWASSIAHVPHAPADTDTAAMGTRRQPQAPVNRTPESLLPSQTRQLLQQQQLRCRTDGAGATAFATVRLCSRLCCLVVAVSACCWCAGVRILATVLAEQLCTLVFKLCIATCTSPQPGVQVWVPEVLNRCCVPLLH